MTVAKSLRQISPLIIVCSFLITFFSVEAIAQARGGWYANQSMARQSQMMRQQRAAQQRQAAQAQQRRQQQTMQRQRLQQQRAAQIQRQRVQQNMRQRQQAIASRRAAMQSRQRAIQQQRQNSIRSRQNTSATASTRARPTTSRSNIAQTRSLRQQKLAQVRSDRLRQLRVQRDKEKRERERRQREDRDKKNEQRNTRQNDNNVSLGALASRTRTVTSQPVNRPSTTGSFRQNRLTSRTNQNSVTQKFQQQRNYVQARAKQLKNLSQQKLADKPKTNSQARQNTQTAASRNFGRCNGNKCQCSFDGDTGVLTSKGLVKIRDITAGDTLVWSKNDKTGDTSWQPVLDHYSNFYESQVHIELTSLANGVDQKIVSNKIHPFFVINTGLRPVSSNDGKLQAGSWVEAQDLKSGDYLLSAYDTITEVIGVSYYAAELKAFNLKVANNHTYFVSASNVQPDLAVWVHNDCNNNKSSQPSSAKESVVIKVDPRGVANVSVRGKEMSIHANEQATNHRISHQNIANALKQKPFDYVQKGDKLKGYYDKNSNTFVGVGNRITTVIKPRNPVSYLNNVRDRK